MTPDEQPVAILETVLKGLFPNAPFDVTLLADRIIEGLSQSGWSLTYDPKYTRESIERLVEEFRGKYPPPTSFIPPQPPERLQ